MNTRLLEAVCYGVSQWNKARIANRLALGCELNADDAIFLGHTGDVGEHLAAAAYAAGIASGEVDAKDLTKAVEDAGKAYDKREPMGAHIENMRREALVVLKTQPTDFVEELTRLLAAGERPIKLDVNAGLNEGTPKP